MANWDKNKTICSCCAVEIFIFIAPLDSVTSWAEFNEDSRRLSMKAKLRWWRCLDGRREHSPSSTGQANETWEQRRRMTNTALFGSERTLTCIHTPTSPLPTPTGSPPTIHLSSDQMWTAANKFSFPLGGQGHGVSLLYSWSTGAVGHQLPDQRKKEKRSRPGETRWQRL